MAGRFQRGPLAESPWGTLVVNALGCFLFGLIRTATQERCVISPETRAIILIGFLGSFTTFSSFLFETNQMPEHGLWLPTALNVAGEPGLDLGACLFGVFVGRVV